MNLESIKLHEIKDNNCTVTVYEVPRVVKYIQTESRLVAARGGGGEWEAAAKGL